MNDVLKKQLNSCKKLFRHIPTIAIEKFIDVIISLYITTCFGPYGPSSCEYSYNYYLKHLRENHRYHNGSVVHKFVSYYI
jgi:hypothetical protein